MGFAYLKNGETLALDASRCIGCRACIEVCPHDVFRPAGATVEIAHRGACMECGACARNCPAGALTVVAGVGCAGAIILGKLRGTAPTCGGEDCGCGGSAGSCC